MTSSGVRPQRSISASCSAIISATADTPSVSGMLPYIQIDYINAENDGVPEAVDYPGNLLFSRFMLSSVFLR